MTPEETAQTIANGCIALGEDASKAQIRQYAALLKELERWGARINLTAIRDSDAMISAHLLDSLAVRHHLRGDSVIDIGTGAGFPGLPLAIAEPQRQFVLLDSNGKKINFVRHIITMLALSNVTAVKSRAEDYAPGHPFDTVIARALAPIAKIVELGEHLIGEKGVLLALKGRYPAEELAQIPELRDQWKFEVEEIQVPGLEQHSRHVVSLERRAE